MVSIEVYGQRRVSCKCTWAPELIMADHETGSQLRGPLYVLLLTSRSSIRIHQTRFRETEQLGDFWAWSYCWLDHSLYVMSPYRFHLANGTDTTMPLDNIKTRMQSTGAESRYRNSFDCLRVIVRDEGIPRLWGGTTPRLARLMVSH